MTTEPSNEPNERTRDLSASESGPDAGPGVPEELREMIARWLYEYEAENALSWEELSPSERVMGQMDADNLIAEIAASGFEIVASDRLGRLIEAARRYESWIASICGEYLDKTRQCTPVLELGDLDPLDLGEAGDA